MIPLKVRQLISVKEDDLKIKPNSNETSELETFDNVKDRLSFVVEQIYVKQGFNQVEKFLSEFSDIQFTSTIDYTDYKGLACELYLLYFIKAYILKYKLDWHVEHSYYVDLPQKTKSGYSQTEIDICLFTPECIVVFECKSYKGVNKIKNICTLEGSSTSKDINKQNSMHIECALREFEKYNIVNKGSLKSVLFVLTKEDVIDSREEKFKRLIPVLSQRNIYTFLEAVRNLSDIKWKYKELTGNIIAKKGASK